MSAIFGLVRFDGRGVSQRDLECMAAAMRHRGPDGRRWVVDGPVGLGHCLMRVNREDVFEAQPILDREAGLTLVGDLRIDNREDIASALGMGTAELGDTPDSALVLRAHKKWGDDCAGRLLGDFAFAIWDGRSRTLTLARDHMGQRQVHYHRGDTFFAFATNLQALWTVRDVPQVLSELHLARRLFGDRSSRDGETWFEGIRGLTGATVMTIDAGGHVSTRRYWEPRADPAHERRDEGYYVEAYRRVLGEAVACRIRRTIRGPGILFSGGYDSAAIAGLAGPVLAPSGRKLVAAASVMPADYRGTIRHARPWVGLCARDMPHLDVRYVTRDGKSVLTDLERAFMAEDGPASAYHFVATELLSTLAGAGAQLIMDGHGGDCTLNPRGEAALARFLATGQLRRFLSELRGHLRLTDRSVWTTFRRDVAARLLPPSLAAWWRRARHGFAPIWSDRPIGGAFARRLITEGRIDPRTLRGGAIGRTDMRARMESVLCRVAAAPAPAMAASAAIHGLELTRPFHDKRVVELALAIPQDLYVKNGRNRYIACLALKDLYPREFQTRWRRNDDEIPDFQRMAKAIETRLLADISRMERSESLARYFDFAKIRALLAGRGPDDHNSGWEQETQVAIQGFMIASYVEWFGRHNR